jgi:5-methylcytosine-specific restriction protein A
MASRPPVHRPSAPGARRHTGDTARGTAASRGYDGKWQRYRAGFLAAHPLCARCLAGGRTTAATVVDHITPHKGDARLFWNTANHQPLCKPCHDHKTATEDGGFGRTHSPYIPV